MITRLPYGSKSRLTVYLLQDCIDRVFSLLLSSIFQVCFRLSIHDRHFAIIVTQIHLYGYIFIPQFRSLLETLTPLRTTLCYNYDPYVNKR